MEVWFAKLRELGELAELDDFSKSSLIQQAVPHIES